MTQAWESSTLQHYVKCETCCKDALSSLLQHVALFAHCPIWGGPWKSDSHTYHSKSSPAVLYCFVVQPLPDEDQNRQCDHWLKNIPAGSITSHKHSLCDTEGDANKCGLLMSQQFRCLHDHVGSCTSTLPMLKPNALDLLVLNLIILPVLMTVSTWDAQNFETCLLGIKTGKKKKIWQAVIFSHNLASPIDFLMCPSRVLDCYVTRWQVLLWRPGQLWAFIFRFYV